MRRVLCAIVAVAVLVYGADADRCFFPRGITEFHFGCVDAEGCCEMRNASAPYFSERGEDEQDSECVPVEKGRSASAPFVCYSNNALTADYKVRIVPTVPGSVIPLFTVEQACTGTFVPSREHPGRGWCLDSGLSPSAFVASLMQLPLSARAVVSELVEHAPSLYESAKCQDAVVCPFNDIHFEPDAAGKAHAAITAITLTGLAAWAALGVWGDCGRGGAVGWARERRWLVGVHAASLAHGVSAAGATSFVNVPVGELSFYGGVSVFALLPVASLAALCVVAFTPGRRRWCAAASRVSLLAHPMALVTALSWTSRMAPSLRDMANESTDTTVSAVALSLLLSATSGALYVVNVAWLLVPSVCGASQWEVSSCIPRPVLFARTSTCLCVCAAAVCCSCVWLGATMLTAQYGTFSSLIEGHADTGIASNGRPLGALVALGLVPLMWPLAAPWSAASLRAKEGVHEGGNEAVLATPLLFEGEVELSGPLNRGTHAASPSSASHAVEEMQAIGPFMIGLSAVSVTLAFLNELSWGNTYGNSILVVYASVLVLNGLAYLSLQFSVAESRDASGAGVAAETMPAGLVARLAWLTNWHNVHRLGVANSATTLAVLLVFVTLPRSELTLARAAPLLAASVVTLLSSSGALVQRRWPAWKLFPADDNFRLLTLLKASKVVLKGVLLADSARGSSLEVASLVLYAGSSLVLVLVTFVSVARLWRDPSPLLCGSGAGSSGGAKSALHARCVILAYLLGFAASKVALVLVAVMSSGVMLPCGVQHDDYCDDSDLSLCGKGPSDLLSSYDFHHCCPCAVATDAVRLVLSLLLVVCSYLNNETARWLEGRKQIASNSQIRDFLSANGGIDKALGAQSSTRGVLAMERLSQALAVGGTVGLATQEYPPFHWFFLLLGPWIVRTAVYAWALEGPMPQSLT